MRAIDALPAACFLLAALARAEPPAALPGPASAPFLHPGAATPDCRSALRIGPVACADAATGEAGARKARLERAVDDFLAGYGKPPREAVRALLDPTDQNIAAWALAQRRTLDLAAYVGNRLTALQRADASPSPDAIAPATAPATAAATAGPAARAP
jgi:hypothetical protein